MYPIVILDALRIKIRDADSRQVQNKAVYVALGVSRDGTREVLGLWLAGNEGAKFWLSVMNELKNRGVPPPMRQPVNSMHSRKNGPGNIRLSRRPGAGRGTR